MSRHRDWCFTIFSSEATDCERLSCELKKKCKRNDAVVYCIVGIEVCPDTQRKHLQGYISLKNAKSLKALQKFTNAYKIKHHAEVRRGTAAQARNYCWKGPSKKRTPEPHADAIWWEKGILPIGQGKRTDIMKTKESLINGANLRNIITETSSCQSITYAQKWLTYFEKPRCGKPTITWCHGPTETGKSRYAFHAFEGLDYFVANETNKWWDGYDGHKYVIIDDMRSNFATYHQLLRLLDRYECKIEYKGGYRQFVATNIIITCSRGPECMYPNISNKSELVRRIDNIIQFPRPNMKIKADFFGKLHKG